MPATLVTDPLGLSCVFSNGQRWSFAVRSTLNPRLTADLLTGLAALLHPHGRIDSQATVRFYAAYAAVMVDRLAEQGFTGTAADLTRARLAGFWMAAGPRAEPPTRAMLTALDAQTGVLHPDVRELATGRRFNPMRQPTPLPPYSEGEWARLRATCRRLLTDAYTIHRRVRAAAARGADPRVAG